VPLPSDPSAVDRLALAFRALAHPTRLRILDALRGGNPQSPSQVGRQIEPKLALGTVSHHMRELMLAGLVEPAGTRAVRGALEHFYELSPEGRQMLKLVDRVAA
jgi:DNA-binding transcriptional ArsR family regulator